VTAEILADFLRDIDDPRRAVEIDDRVPADTGRTNPNPGTKNTKGYTGLEGLLNYAYYQAGAVNQFDQIGHLLHFSLYNIFTGPCGNFSSGRDPQTGARGVPAEGGGTTTNILQADNCVAWLGQNQPGINEDLGLPKYDPSVCPQGTQPEAAADELCSPGGTQASSGGRSPRAGRGQGAPEPAPDTTGGGAGGSAGGSTDSGDTGDDGGSGSGGPIPNDILDQILDLPPRALDNLPGDLGDQLGGGADQQQNGGGGSAPAPAPGGGGATDDLLDFLFSS
jgi:hypothetical protein